MNAVEIRAVKWYARKDFHQGHEEAGSPVP